MHGMILGVPSVDHDTGAKGRRRIYDDRGIVDADPWPGRILGTLTGDVVVVVLVSQNDRRGVGFCGLRVGRRRAARLRCLLELSRRSPPSRHRLTAARRHG